MKLAHPRNSRTRAPAHRWRIPPPLRGSVGSHGPEGISILEEIGGSLGRLLWNTLRSVNAWIDTPPTDRNGLFPDSANTRYFADLLEAAPAPELETPLRELTFILESPAKADSAAIGLACGRVAKWAEHDGYARTAAEYFQAAANVCIGNPHYALAAGKASRDLADYPRADAWLKRAIGISRQREDWRVYTRAHLSYGKLMLMRGKVPAAEKNYRRALRRAVRIANRELQGMALHDLMVVESEMERWQDAERYAEQAIVAYPAGHRDIPRLAADVAYIWLKQENFTAARAVLIDLMGSVDRNERPAVAGSLAHAAGGCNDRNTFDQARTTLSGIGDGPGVAEAWVDVARGGLCMQRPTEALVAANNARRLAERRAEHKIVFLAEQVQQSAIRSMKESLSHRGHPVMTEGYHGQETAEQLLRKLTPA